MSRQKDFSALQQALPPGIELTYCLRAEPRLRRQLFNIFVLGLLFVILLRRPRAHVIGLTADELFIMPLPRPRNDAGVTMIRRTDLTRLIVQGGAIRTKVTIDTATDHYRLRVPGVAARGYARDALIALANFGASVPQPTQPFSPAPAVAPDGANWSVAGVPASASVARPGAIAANWAVEQSRLVVIDGPLAGRSYALNAESTGIGRRNTNDIVLPDRGVSGHHADIERTQGGRYILTDRGSSNGILLNGELMARPSELNANDVLCLGTTSLRFESGS